MEWDISSDRGINLESKVDVPEGWPFFYYAYYPGYFVYLENYEKVGLLEWKTRKTIKILLKEKGIHRISVLGDSLAAIVNKQLIFMEGILKV